jgi:hypothetical protein
MSGETTSLWAGFWDLLRQTEPRSGCYDVEWDGPYYIPRPLQWHRSRFMVYGGTLFGFLEVGWSRLDAAWDLATGRLSYEARARSTGGVAAEQIWDRAMPQLVRRLDAAVADPDGYNRRVRRLLPLEARTGVVVRRWSWPSGTRAPLAPRELEALDAACRTGERSEPLASLTAATYLALAGVGYAAAYPELSGLSPREQHAAKADTRHGGGISSTDRKRWTPISAFPEPEARRQRGGVHVVDRPHGTPLHLPQLPRCDHVDVDPLETLGLRGELREPESLAHTGHDVEPEPFGWAVAHGGVVPTQVGGADLVDAGVGVDRAQRGLESLDAAIANASAAV